MEHNRFKNGRRDLRRISFANVHTVIPLPDGFFPSFVDCSNILSEPQMHSDDSAHTDTVSCQSACILIVGNSSGHIIALRLVAMQSREETQLNKAKEITSFSPSAYDASIVWQYDFSTLNSLFLPYRSIHAVVPNAPISSPYLACNIGVIIHDAEGTAAKVTVLSKEGAVSTTRRLQAAENTFFLASVSKFCNRNCNEVLRIHHNYFNIVNAPNFSSRLQNAYLIKCVEGYDYIFLPNCQIKDKHVGDCIPSEGDNGDRMIICHDIFEEERSILVGYIDDRHVLSLVLHPMTEESAPADSNQNGGIRIRANTELNSSIILFPVILGLLNTHDFEGLFSPVPYSYEHLSVDIVKEIISVLKSKDMTLLSKISNCLETFLKDLIQRPNFSKHDEDFAVITNVLFAADENFFIEIFSKLSRKLEPHISCKLFPLPNCQVSNIIHQKSLLRPPTPVYCAPAEPRRGRVDSPWDQIRLFELCLVKKSLSHASRFLSIACEQLGGSQSIETIVACLIISVELLLECLENLCLDNALGCIDFCERLDKMAMELTYTELENQREKPSTAANRVLHALQCEVVDVMGLLSPIIGSDLHDVVQDAFDPHNERNRSRLRVYQSPVYKHRAISFDLDKSTPPEFVRLSLSEFKYTAFCIANERIEAEEQPRQPAFPEDCGEPHLPSLFPASYTSAVIHRVVEKFVKHGQWLSASMEMSSIQEHALTSSRSTVSWLENYLFYNKLSVLDVSPLGPPTGVMGMIEVLGMDPAVSMSPTAPLNSDENEDLRRLLLTELSREDLVALLEREFRCSQLGGQARGSDRAINRDFDLPEANGGVLSLLSLFRGAAGSALITGHVDILLFISTVLCKSDVAAACLNWNDLQCRLCVINFFLSRCASESTGSDYRHIPDSSARKLYNSLFSDESMEIGSIAQLIERHFYASSE